MPRTRIARVIDWLCTLSGYLSSILLSVAMLVVCYGVVVRYLLGGSTVWQTEMAIYLLMFASFVGGAYGLQHGDHVRIDLVTNLLPPRGRIIMHLVAAVLATLFTVTVTIISTVMWFETAKSGARSGTAWNPSLSVPHFIVPLGMGLISLQYFMICGRLAHGLFTGVTEVREFASGEKEIPQ